MLRRIFARLLDYGFFLMLCFGVLLFTPFIFSSFSLIVFLCLTPLLALPLEVLLLKRFFTTPGKALLGIHLDGNPNIKQILKRSLRATFKVYLYCIPLLNIVALYHLKNADNFFHDQDCPLKISKWKPWKSIPLVLFATITCSFFYSETIQDSLFQMNSSFHKLQSIELIAGETIQWKSFTSPEKEFKIAFPKKPKQEETELPIPKSKEALPYKEFHSTHGDAIKYSLSYTELPSPWLRFSSNLVLKASLKIISKHISKGNIVSKTISHHYRYPCIHYSILRGDQEMKGELILIGNRLYKLEVSYPREAAASIAANTAEFFSSFKPIPKT